MPPRNLLPAPPPSEPRSTALAISPHGALHLDRTSAAEVELAPEVAERIAAAFERSTAEGLLHLGSVELATELPPSLAFGRELGKLFFLRLGAIPDLEAERRAIHVPPPEDELAALAFAAPPMIGAEYLAKEALIATWASLEHEAQRQIDAFTGSVEQYLHEKSALFNLVGRIYLHLAENKGNERAPFAFLATCATRLSKQAKVQHTPLGRAVEEYAGDRQRLLALLAPVQRASEKSAFVRSLIDSGEIFHPLAWTPRQAHAFLRDVPALEESGVIVRVPNWWRRRNPPRPRVRVTLGGQKPGGVGADALLDFDVSVTLDGETISPAEWRALLASSEGLALVKGKWVEVDAERLRQVLDHWKSVEQATQREGLSFLEGMRLLSGMPADLDDGLDEVAAAEWSEVTAGRWLDEVLADLRHPEGSREADPGDALRATLRPYQRDGVAWLVLLARLGLGACLADDMGLGKTVQLLALLLVLARKGERGPHLLVVPASLIGNWRAEMARFAPSLRAVVAHPSELGAAELATPEATLAERPDVVITTYGTVARTAWITEQTWGLVVLDEAQAIKNPDAKQTRAVKRLRGRTRIALTGTPVENRLGDLWSLFDFLCPGLLGSAAVFRGLARRMSTDERGYAPLRELVRPYILRRMKSDKSVVADLPDKTEVRAFCSLTKAQAALYTAAVEELAARIDDIDGIERRGVVLAFLLRFKQICNHPSQSLGDGAYRPADSGKLARLRELCEPIAARQEKVLVFTQFREMTGPLADFLEGVFGRRGLVLHGETPVKKRAALVAEFQDEAGPPFFVLSLKAGGTGLNLTAASHVVHFDRWWNPAVEDQATDRAYRIGQKKNVLVHKFVCRGTIEEKIDAMIEDKRSLSAQILTGGGEAWLTELPSDELLRLVSLDLGRALEEG